MRRLDNNKKKGYFSPRSGYTYICVCAESMVYVCIFQVFFLFVPGFCADKFRRDKFYVRLFDCF